ncbi:MAG: hypothetical protein GWN99_05590, partial [Gemmatimonadetes bacterium]|nr:hypothetical protein [Gemmatimonadota bacterium]NIR76160.1 hypothetical protein [Candidatus Kutchimonas denitrificans]NIS00539.1 hypothetical protein [Gemmatimonadota bacterium]NIT66197.1 hypothetical protein [Gemmatimonadota bacterium]NIU54275.1 hypothetical protein [Gemmatimonadota bacterium]
MSDSKPLLILAVLALRPDRSASRDYLADLLWPDSDRTRSRRSLRQAIFNISRNASDELLIDDEARSGLNLARERLAVDIVEFDEALEREDFAAAARIHRGPFLAGVDHRAGSEFESWVDSQQSRVRIGLEVAYTHLVSDALEAGETERAVEHARAFADLNPLDERAQSTLVRALRAAGDEVGALQAYEAYRTLLERELGEDPARELEERVDEIRDEVLGPATEVLDSTAAPEVEEPSPEAERPPAPSPPPPPSPPPRPARPAAGWWRLRDL